MEAIFGQRSDELPRQIYDPTLSEMATRMWRPLKYLSLGWDYLTNRFGFIEPWFSISQLYHYACIKCCDLSVLPSTDANTDAASRLDPLIPSCSMLTCSTSIRLLMKLMNRNQG